MVEVISLCFYKFRVAKDTRRITLTFRKNCCAAVSYDGQRVPVCSGVARGGGGGARGHALQSLEKNWDDGECVLRHHFPFTFRASTLSTVYHLPLFPHDQPMYSSSISS